MAFCGPRSPETIAKFKATQREKFIIRNEKVLTFLQKNPGERTSREIVEGSGLRYYQVIGAINVLEKMGFVECRRPGQIGANKPKLFVKAIRMDKPDYSETDP